MEKDFEVSLYFNECFVCRLKFIGDNFLLKIQLDLVPQARLLFQKSKFYIMKFSNSSLQDEIIFFRPEK